MAYSVLTSASAVDMRCGAVRCCRWGVLCVCVLETKNQQSKQMIKNKAIYVVTHCEVRFYWYLSEMSARVRVRQCVQNERLIEPGGNATAHYSNWNLCVCQQLMRRANDAITQLTTANTKQKKIRHSTKIKRHAIAQCSIICVRWLLVMWIYFVCLLVFALATTTRRYCSWWDVNCNTINILEKHDTEQRLIP